MKKPIRLQRCVSLEVRNALVPSPANGNPDYRRTRYRTVLAYSEAVRTLRNTIRLGGLEGQRGTILVTSASATDGKTTAAANLASANAEHGRKTLLIDADLRRPAVHKGFGMWPGTGLSDVLQGKRSWKHVLVTVDDRPNLTLLPAGPPSRRAADLASPRIVDLLDEMAREYDLIIVDGPPLLGFAEPLEIAKAVDGVLVVVRAGKTKRQAASAALAALRRVRANVVGIVLNDVEAGSASDYSYDYACREQV